MLPTNLPQMRKQDDKGKLNKNYKLDLAGVTTMEKTTISIKKTTYRRIIETRGKLESRDGKRHIFSIEDVINELINYYERKTE